MHTVIIVDDEKDIRKSLYTHVSDFFAGEVNIVEAQDGKEALMVCESIEVDIIITDIQMQNLNGLEFIKVIRQRNEDVAVIIITGFEEFDYAYKAIQLGVLQYLLKPINKVDLDIVLKKAVDAIESKNSRKKLLSEHQRHTVEMRKQYIRELIRDTELSAKKTEAVRSYIEDHHVTVLLFRMQAEKENSEGIMGYVEMILGQLWGESLAFWVEHRMTMVVLSDDTLKQDELQYLYQKVEDYAVTQDIHHLVLGVSESRVGYEELPDLYGQARKAVKQRLVLGKKIIYAKDIEGLEAQAVLPIDLYKEIVEAINIGDKKSVNDILNSIFQDSQRYQIQYMELIYNELKSYLFLNLICHKPDIQSDSMVKRMMGSHIYQYNSMTEMIINLKTFCYALCDLINNTRACGDSKEILIQGAKNYIRKHMNEDITMAQVANHLDVSYAYFSRTFKGVTGRTFSQYIKDMRLTRAKELLKDVTLDIKDVAKMVGYDSARHFSETFEKHIGLRPSVYKKQIGIDIE